MLEKPKLRFDIDSITIKANIKLSEKETGKYPRNIFTIIIVLDSHLGIDDWDFTLFEQCETDKQVKPYRSSKCRNNLH